MGNTLARNCSAGWDQCRGHAYLIEEHVFRPQTPSQAAARGLRVENMRRSWKVIFDCACEVSCPSRFPRTVTHVLGSFCYRCGRYGQIDATHFGVDVHAFTRGSARPSRNPGLDDETPSALGSRGPSEIPAPTIAGDLVHLAAKVPRNLATSRGSSLARKAVS
jgi:hypothetical protein